MVRLRKTSTLAIGVNGIQVSVKGEKNKNLASGCTITSIIHQEQIIKYCDFVQRAGPQGHEIEADEWVLYYLF